MRPHPSSPPIPAGWRRKSRSICRSGDRLDPAFRALVDDIYARMTARAPATSVNDGLFPGTGIAVVLLRLSTNSLAGLIEEVDGTPFDGRAGLHLLPGCNHLTFGD